MFHLYMHDFISAIAAIFLDLGLERDLQLKLHGQHLAQSVVLKAIQGFINNPESNKPLTLSFHGWSGTGKNFVARLVADNLYRDGVKSECVRLFIAPFHFPHARLVDVYKVSNSHNVFMQTLLLVNLASYRLCEVLVLGSSVHHETEGCSVCEEGM